MVAHCYRPKRYLGSTRGIKGHEDFIDAMALLRRGGVDVVGVIAGGAWKGAESYYASVKEYAYATADANVIFLGTRADVAAVYSDLDVAVHPSLSDNLGGAAESLLLGVPTVTTNVGGFPDLILEGVTGRMVPPREPVRLSSAIGALLRDRAGAAAMAREGRRHARHLLDVRRTGAQIASIYERIGRSGRTAGSRSRAVAGAAAG
jgi:glycosyltransferase involved in cell wall biosynthesis